MRFPGDLEAAGCPAVPQAGREVGPGVGGTITDPLDLPLCPPSSGFLNRTVGITATSQGL